MDILSPSNKLAARLREAIRKGTYTLGERLPTERELTRQFRLSRRTVRRALDILEAERLIARQQGRGTFVANPAYAATPNERTALIGTLVHEREYYFEAVIQGVSAQAAKRGFATTTGSNRTPAEESEQIAAFLRNAIKGVVLAPNGSHSKEAYETLLQAQVPVVLLDTLLPGCREDYVTVDNWLGTHLATQHLIDQGHKRIAYVGLPDPEDIPCQPERKRGFLDTCKEHGLKVPNEWIVEMAGESFGNRISELLQSTSRPTAFVCYSDHWAIGVIQAARDLGFSVPADLSVVGFDDSTLAQNYDIPITSIAPEHRTLGIASANILIDKIENPQSRPKMGIVVMPRLVIRDSVAPPFVNTSGRTAESTELPWRE